MITENGFTSTPPLMRKEFEFNSVGNKESPMGLEQEEKQTELWCRKVTPAAIYNMD